MAYLDSAAGLSDDPTTISSAKNKQLAARISGTFGDYDKAKATSDSGLADYISSYFSGAGDAKNRTGSEIVNLDRYFDGGAASELAGLRLNRSNAVGDAAQRAADMALAHMKLSRAGGEGGPSSYDSRLALRSTGDILSQAALDNAQQERGDWDFLERQKLGLTGQRQSLADVLMKRSLMPGDALKHELGADVGLLNQIGQVDQANTFYGLKNHPGPGEGFVSDYGSIMDAY